MKNDWIVTVKFPDMPADTDADSIAILLNAILDSNGEVTCEILKIERAK